MQLVYDTLFIKNERFDIVPSLAESLEESPDHKTFKFKLHSGVTFHNGKPLTSADVKYTFESLISPELRSPIRGSFDKITSIETPDPLTVIFHAREPFYTFVGSLPVVGIIPENAGSEMMNAPIGSGPYRVESYREGQAVELIANQNYWKGAPQVPRVTVKVVIDNSTRQAELMSGEVDLAYNAQFDPETVRALARRDDIQVITDRGANVDYMGLNVAGPVTGSPGVRTAIALAVDRDAIIHHLLRDQARRADAIMPPEHWAFESGVRNHPYDPDLAKALLDESGFKDPDGDGPEKRFSLTLTTSTTQLSRNIASIIQEQLGRVGIDLNLQSLEFATMMDRITRGEYDLYYLRGIGFNQSPDVFQFVYHSRFQEPEFVDAIGRLRGAREERQIEQITREISSILGKRTYCPGEQVQRALMRDAGSAAELKQKYLEIARILTDRGGQNRMRYCNPEVDNWIVQAELADDPAIKKEYYSRIQKVVSIELPQIYLWYTANVLVARKRVGNIEVEPTGSWYFITKLTLNN